MYYFHQSPLINKVPIVVDKKGDPVESPIRFHRIPIRHINIYLVQINLNY